MTPKKLMTYPNSNLYPITIDGHLWPQCIVVKDHFLVIVKENRDEAEVLFKDSSDSSSESAFSECKTFYGPQRG